MHKNKDNCLS